MTLKKNRRSSFKYASAFLLFVKFVKIRCDKPTNYSKRLIRCAVEKRVMSRFSSGPQSMNFLVDKSHTEWRVFDVLEHQMQEKPPTKRQAPKVCNDTRGKN
jgi:hypothetical protein